jgi:AraC-like DNA-binding protein
MPTEKHSYDKKSNFIKRFTKYHGFTKEEYRKKYISPLRKYLDLVE